MRGHGRAHARHGRPGSAQADACPGGLSAGGHHDGLLHHRDRHRSHPAGGLRLHAQALRHPASAGAAATGPGRGREPAPPRGPVRRGGAGRRGRHPPGGTYAPHAGAVQGHRPRGAHRCPGADPGRIRHGQGAGGQCHLALQSALPPPVLGHQLRGHPRHPAGERTVRL